MATCASRNCNQTYHAGPGCQSHGSSLSGETLLTFDTVDTAGDIFCYYLQLFETAGTDYDIEFSLQTKDNGTYSYISGTETGVLTNGVASGASGCQCFEDGTDFTTTVQASVGDYLSCWFESKQPIAASGGAGIAYRNNTNTCESTAWTPNSSQPSWDSGVGMEVVAGAQQYQYTAQGTMTSAGEYQRKLRAKRTIAGSI